MYASRGFPGIGLIVVVIIVVIRLAARSGKSRGNSSSAYPTYPNQPYQTPAGFAQPGLQQPAPIQAEWYFLENNTSTGPLTWGDFCANVSSGRIRSATLVYGPGMAGWIEAKMVTGLVFPNLPATWTCPKCSQQVGETVNACWKCGAGRV